MNPPRHILDEMLADGHIGELTSIICLGAALVVKNGGPSEITEISDPRTGERVPPELEEFLKMLHIDTVAALKVATPDELDHAIALYTAHLKEAGYTIEAGYDH
jgi:hypothetical protein